MYKVFNLCCSMMNITTSLANMGTELCIIPRRYNHFNLETLAALMGMISKAEGKFSVREGGRVGGWEGEYLVE